MRLVLALLACLACPTESFAALYYSATGVGSDANSCSTALTGAVTPANSKATMSAGVACLSPGDTLFVRNGTYNETLQFTIPSGTDWGAGLVRVAAYPGEAVTLAPTSTAPWGTAIEFGYGQKYIELDGISIDATNVISDAIKIDNFTDGFAVDQLGHHIRVKNGFIKNHPGFGIVISNLIGSGGEVGYNEFQHLVIYCEVAYAATCNLQNGAFTHQIYLQTGNNLVEYCTIVDAGGNGIQIRSDDYYSTAANVIRFNVVHDILKDNMDGRHRGIVVVSGVGNQIYGNLLYNIEGSNSLTSAIQVVYAQDTLIYGNTAYNGNQYGFFSGGDITTGTIWRNNIAYGFSGGNFHDETDTGSGKTVTQDHNIFASDPLFTNVGTLDFTLQTSSPARNAGADISAVVTVDLTGTVRPQESLFDAGAYEFVFGAPTGPGAYRLGLKRGH